VRAGRIVLGLQGALDLDKGGDLARNLYELYSYVTRRLVHVNARNDLDALQEVHTLLMKFAKLGVMFLTCYLKLRLLQVSQCLQCIELLPERARL